MEHFAMLAGARFRWFFWGCLCAGGCTRWLLGIEPVDQQPCTEPAHCPGTDTECKKRTCIAGVCGVEFAAQKSRGFDPLPDPVDGDCHAMYCDGDGGVVDGVDDEDVPPDDGYECTVSRCTNGMPSDHEVDQTPGDCNQVKCDYSEGGKKFLIAYDADVPEDDGNTCTLEGCTNGEPTERIDEGAACDRVQGGRCSADGECLPTFMVVRVGTGPRASQGFVERRFFIEGSEAMDDIELSVEDRGEQEGITFSDFSRDAALSLSADGRYVTLLGYGAEPGYIEVARAPNPPHRVVARIDSNKNVDTSTVLTTAFSGRNSRAAVSVDGTEFWVAGAGEGIYYIPFGARGGEIRILSQDPTRAPATLRDLSIFDSQLYGSSGDAGFQGVFKVGEGLPKTAGTTVTMLPGLEQRPPEDPCSFVLFDRDLTPGPDTLYIADNENGIEKWTLNASTATWNRAEPFNLGHDEQPLPDGVGMQGIAGMLTPTAVSDTAVTLIATTTDVTRQNRIYMYVDEHTTVPIPKLLATAPPGFIYRGLALAP